MLRHLRASDDRFKPVAFRPGLNLIVADTTGRSSRTDTRNGAGKSSLIELLHFLLGARLDRTSFLAKEELREIEFELTLQWPTSPTKELKVRRSPERPNEVYIEPDIRTANLLPGMPGGVSLADWQGMIERDLFHLPDEHGGVTGRAMLSLYLRRVSANAFNEAVRTTPQQSLPDATTNIAYLLGLDWRLASRYRELAAREATRRKLAAAAKDPVWGQIVGRSSELRGQMSVAQQRVRELSRQIAEYRVVPHYENLQQQADELNQRIRQLRADDLVDRRNLRDFLRAIEEESSPDVSYLEQVYSDLGVALDGAVRRRFDEVREFHASIIRNRREYLESEVQAMRARLAEREAERARLDAQLAEILRTLNEGGALDALTALQQALARDQAALEALRHRFEAAQTLEASRAEIQADRATLEAEVRADLIERDEIVDDVSVRFLRYATELYGKDRQAFLEVGATTTYLKIVPHIDSENSRGIKNMVIFCFDLAVAVTAHRGSRGPDFLVHDSHLFDGVDSRQIARALSLAERVAEAEKMQYVATMNTDDLQKVRTQGVDLSDAVIPPQLTDKYDNGGLFGFRFS